MDNYIFVEYQVLEVEYDPNGLISSVVAHPHARLNPVAPDTDYLFTRELMLSRIKDNEPFFIRHGEMTFPIHLVEVEGFEYIRTDDQLIPEDFVI